MIIMIQTEAVETLAIGHWKGTCIFQQTIMIPLEILVQSIQVLSAIKGSLQLAKESIKSGVALEKCRGLD
jgi:hypothetical protein